MGLRLKIILSALFLIALKGLLLFLIFPLLVVNEVTHTVTKVTESVESRLQEFFQDEKSWSQKERESHIQEIQESIPRGFVEIKKQFERKIFLELLGISLLILFFIFILIWFMNKEIIRPLTLLAAATDKITEGHFDAVILPSMGHRHDEIAQLTAAFAHMVEGLKEREKIRSVLDKVVSKEVAEEILKSTLHLGGEDRNVTMLFSDIRGFTTLTEELSPQETIEILNLYMTKMSRVIENEGGIIDKYVGDEIMALFGAPVEHPQHALRAISTGMLMIETIKGINRERAKIEAPLFEMGIGIHTGVVVAGNMGAEDRLNYTVLGKNVNLAARLCKFAKPGQLIISEHTLQEPSVASSFIVKQLDQISLKGFSTPVAIYEVIGFQWNEA